VPITTERGPSSFTCRRRDRQQDFCADGATTAHPEGGQGPGSQPSERDTVSETYHAIHTDKRFLGWLRVRDEYVEGIMDQRPWLGEGPFEGVLSDHQDWKHAACTLGPGEFHPRIQRDGRPGGVQPAPPNALVFAKECQSSVTALLSLFSRLEPILRIIEPSKANMATYGHELRHILILACTEVESGLKAVLVANEIEPTRNDTYSIRDYRKLLGPMRLDDWRIALDGHDELGVFVRFAGWEDHAAPSWWAAYNRVKHDRESELHRATVENMLQALSAAYIVTAAQFGFKAINAPHEFPRVTQLMVASDGWPSWAPEEFYLPPKLPGGHDDWTRVPLGA
jgi:hypothetical protein